MKNRMRIIKFAIKIKKKRETLKECEYKDDGKIVIRSPEDICQVIKNMLGDYADEHFYVYLLNVKNEVVGYVEAGVGGPNKCPVDKSCVFRTAIMLGACSILVAHNHPSDDVKPSQEDILLTKSLIEAGKLLDITVLDHIIVSINNHFSFAQAGMMLS